ncbi:MAG: AmmeMemoRadiSam system radical SAM enzyme [Kiritimatiellae bacterium]|nr:AmmeMemoRadiSam system radical SAM enzyme [Kiritimatiellia bacterium]
MSQVTRREFMWRCAACGLGATLAPGVAAAAWRDRRGPGRRVELSDLKEAAFWEPLPGGRARCLTCPNACEREEGGITACRTRIVRNGKLYSLVYAKPCVIFEDALEKNPLYHVAPGRTALGIGTAGCNLRCSYCQNWNFSQAGPWETRNMDLPPEDLVERAKARGLDWITFSYTEPVAYYEYALDVARLARKQGLRVAVVTGGYIARAPLEELMKHADAFSVTLKGYTDAFYREVIGCPLDAVWNTIRTLARSGKWLEVVTLIVPTLNDEDEGLRAIARSMAALNPQIPIHFLRFAPAWKLKNLPPTPLATLERARDIARAEGLKFVYLDNLPGHPGSNTYCPNCDRLLIERVGFKVLRKDLYQNLCPSCRTPLPGLFLS